MKDKFCFLFQENRLWRETGCCRGGRGRQVVLQNERALEKMPLEAAKEWSEAGEVSYLMLGHPGANLIK